MVSGAGPRLSSRLETWKSRKIDEKWMQIGFGEREPGIGGCFMLSWEQMRREPGIRCCFLVSGRGPNRG